jgi:hypothetical protein
MSGAVKTILPVAGAAAGFMLGGPAGATLGYGLGSAGGGLLGGNEQQQPMQPGVIPEQGPMMPGQVRNPATGAIEGQPGMVLPSAPGGDAAKAQRLMMALGPMLAQSEGLKDSEVARRLLEERIRASQNPPPIMPSGVSAGGIGMGPPTGFSYLGGR